jgi:hypothetical protein
VLVVVDDFDAAIITWHPPRNRFLVSVPVGLEPLSCGL